MWRWAARLRSRIANLPGCACDRDPKVSEKSKLSQMGQDESAQAQQSIATDAFAALVGARQIPPFSSRPGGLSVDNAYRVTPRVRQLYEAGGVRAIGRKIGFTNRTIWPEYGVYAPIWGYVFDHSLHDLTALDTLPLVSFPNHASSPKSCSAFRLRPLHTWTRQPCRRASNG